MCLLGHILFQILQHKRHFITYILEGWGGGGGGGEESGPWDPT